MTDKFLKCIPFIFQHEGGYNNKVNDAGGATNWGISLRFLKSINCDIDGDGDVDWLDIKNLDKDHAEEIYYNNFWKPFYESLSDSIAAKIFDTGVNSGSNRANVLLQQSLKNLGSQISVDGLVGRATLAEISKYNDTSILVQYCMEQKKFYDDIVKRKPDQVEFINGWHNRAMWTPKF